MKINLCLALGLSFFSSFICAQEKSIPSDFVYVKDIIPNVSLEMRYFGSHNFTGRPIRGYEKPVAILTKRAAFALQQVENHLNKKGLGLKIFDAYRPQRAVDNFKSWSLKTGDTIAKREFYPHLDKKNLFKLGFIASKSGHSRGSTVDLTIIRLKDKKEIDMGGPFDFFGAVSHHQYANLTAQQKENRKILKEAMAKFGFKAYDKEWWHYTLQNEPYRKTYFDFIVK
ncbi:M15 family metallopeptidase [Sphingobacterium sp. 2149]|uniref:M15 family metallopeptidase n=1 Tax=Sphingobacterium sp. 2149 TaxID=2817763 RepID=UPI001AEAF397|nr:M15 family metallopeptidase [Sphingobacterium sp. 2149]MDR6733206.1 D-alanyl-D-alanine dipeptidase [Sphingobacterium sp. 2149]